MTDAIMRATTRSSPEEPGDLVAAIAAASHSLGTPLSLPPLRRDLPSLDDGDADVAIAASAAGMIVAPFSRRVNAVRAEDCPFVCRSLDGRWHAIAEIAHGGLAIRIAPDGTREPVALDALTAGRGVKGYALRPAAPTAEPACEERGTVRLGSLRAFVPGPRTLAPVIAATLAINVLALAIPLATMNIFDRVISNAAFETLHALAIGVLLAIGFDFALRTLRAAVLDRGSARADVLSLNALFGRMLGARMSAHAAPGTRGVGVQAHALREYEGVREYLNATSIAALGDLPFVALFLLVIWLVAEPLVVVPLLAVPAFLITALVVQMRLRRLVEGMHGDTAHKNAVATETLSCAESIKLAGGEAWAAGRWERAVASQLRHSLGVRRLTSLSLHLVTLFQGLTTISILVVGVYMVTDLTITPGALFAANLLAGRCLGPLAAVAGLLARLHQTRIASTAVARLAAMPAERPAGRRLVDPTAQWGDAAPTIALESVTHSHDRPDGEPGPNALERVGLRIAPGEHVAIVGGIGSGKSTLMRLIAMLDLPREGRVSMGGIATTDLDPDAWRPRLGALPQVPAFVAGTVRDNVALGRALSDDAVLDALALSGAAEWLGSTSMGLDTPVGERGLGLSGGQLQTLAVARAVVGRPPVLLLDEPTSHLDGRAEAAFAARLRALPATTIAITHRPALIEAADRLIVMEAGRVKLDGPRAEVTATLREMATTRVPARTVSRSVRVGVA